jgi:hypothetical protein
MAFFEIDESLQPGVDVDLRIMTLSTIRKSVSS